MSQQRFGGMRVALAVEAARLMYEEQVKQYFTAKRLACKRLLGRVEGKRARYRPSELPSNGEIREALLALAACAEGPSREKRLFAMRVLALEAMRALEPFEPRLLGSVSTGHIRVGSDIDLHVFTDREEELFVHLDAQGEAYTQERVTILKGGALRDFLHVHLERLVPVELTVYPVRELRNRPRSSTDGKPIERVRASSLQARLARENTAWWERYTREAHLEGLEELRALAEGGPRPGAWDGVLAEGALEALAEEDEELPVEPEPLPDEEDYDPLPGFEEWSAAREPS